MIKNFKHKGLQELHDNGKTKHIGTNYTKKCVRILNALKVAKNPQAMNLVGFGFHELQGVPQRYAVKVNKNWRVTFGWAGEEAIDVELEDYH